MERTSPRYGWYGDDFTGATDTLATLAERDFRALLFLRIPTQAQLAAAGPLDAIGIAGATRAMAPGAMAMELREAGRFFAGLGLDILHYKCCSTFDSAPHVGSLGAAARALRPHFPNPLLPIVGGQPNLGRYCLFGNLFASAGAGGEVHRIDRHPTMSLHPVTPMAEADLRLHLKAQGLERVALIDYRAYEEGDVAATLAESLAARPDAVLMDVSRCADLPVIGRLLWQHAAGGPMLAIGPSSVAQALATSWPRNADADIGASAGQAPRPDGPILALVGSLSPVTRAQVEAASGFLRIDIDVGRLRGEPAYAEALKRETQQHLKERHVMLVTERPAQSAGATESVAAGTGALLRAIVTGVRLSRLIVCGGDTSSLAIKALDLWGLSYRAPMVPGAPLCRAHSDDIRLDGIDIVLKGGQMGPPDFFARAEARD
ncbi:four-carbon acid sugar kinase family protein [Bosea caraganae]|uniref:Four-carbon acid sugar kinase family protein n=1 Tax=Bosea caraganae TaxID=2763117 RepID=A0A370KY91_9HYPH|nr:four-carbon acid sugar kinase family protein [Bosea caraganae]RDJ19953.1 four-carbon acid sugar kinase family protein [Bosea caraganae]RDJ23892.1 four-carbon acid sugar kinase family protein [Bosea caraganae]